MPKNRGMGKKATPRFVYRSVCIEGTESTTISPQKKKKAQQYTLLQVIHTKHSFFLDNGWLSLCQRHTKTNKHTIINGPC